jgi:3-isopropylmalate/(R)-2-methylmalate dehydratase large subunit
VEASFRGRILFLTDDPALVQRQLEGEDLPYDPSRPLMADVSTDEISPAWACFHYDEALGRHTMTGLRGGVVREDAVRLGGFEVLVAGPGFGCGSSREAAPFGQRAAGLRLVIAPSFERIYAQNCQNLGLWLSTDPDLLPRIASGEAIPLEAFTRGLDTIAAEVVRRGGLFAYNQARMAGDVTPPTSRSPRRPMTVSEKILARHAAGSLGQVGVPAVAPGDSLFVRADVRFSHEYVTPMAEALYRHAVGDAPFHDPQSIVLFRDHLTYVDEVLAGGEPGEASRRSELRSLASALATRQAEVAAERRLRLYGEHPAGGAEAICHHAVVEDLALPGMVVVGTDSHTCTAGVLGCFAFGVGSTDMANAWLTGDVRVRVPETVRLVLHGTLAQGVAAKDAALHLLALPWVREGGLRGRVLELLGEGLANLPIDERATLTNMSVEAGATTAVCEPDDEVVAFLCDARGLDTQAVRERIVRADPGAHYAHTLEIDLGVVRPMVALPGDPRNGRPAREVASEGVPIHIAYGGSCTGSKQRDMDMYAAVFAAARARGERVADGVECHIQMGSQAIRRYAEERGYVQLFEEVGARVLGPSCGACINAGPGASRRAEQVTVSAQNRNYPGRSGPGRVYLASPFTVAASAIAGRLVTFDAEAHA